MCFVTEKYPNDHQRNVITDDLARGSCGVPSTWRRPTTRQLGGSPRRSRRVHCPALPPGWRVVALWEVDGMHTPPTPALPQWFSWLAVPETCPPGEGMVWLGQRCGCCCSAGGDRQPGFLMVGTADGLRERLGDAGRRWLVSGGAVCIRSCAGTGTVPEPRGRRRQATPE
jgi:hypothetical protein